MSLAPINNPTTANQDISGPSYAERWGCLSERVSQVASKILFYMQGGFLAAGLSAAFGAAGASSVDKDDPAVRIWSWVTLGLCLASGAFSLAHYVTKPRSGGAASIQV